MAAGLIGADMKIEVEDVSENVRIYPTVGKVRLELITANGKFKQVTFPIRKLDKLTQLLMTVISEGEKHSANEGYGWPITDDEIPGDSKKATASRAMPFPGKKSIGVQIAFDGGGLITFHLDPTHARTLASQIRQATDELATSETFQ